jgi:hypothetical protein
VVQRVGAGICQVAFALWPSAMATLTESRVEKVSGVEAVGGGGGSRFRSLGMCCARGAAPCAGKDWPFFMLFLRFSYPMEWNAFPGKCAEQWEDHGEAPDWESGREGLCAQETPVPEIPAQATETPELISLATGMRSQSSRGRCARSVWPCFYQGATGEGAFRVELSFQTFRARLNLFFSPNPQVK